MVCFVRSTGFSRLSHIPAKAGTTNLLLNRLLGTIFTADDNFFATNGDLYASVSYFPITYWTLAGFWHYFLLSMLKTVERD